MHIILFLFPNSKIVSLKCIIPYKDFIPYLIDKIQS